MPSSPVPVAAPGGPRPAAGPPAPRAPRPALPLPVAAAGLLAVVEALALLAGGLAGLDGVFGTGLRPDGSLVAGTLLLLAGWVVLCAGGGASLVDGAGKLLLVAVAWGEVAVLLVLTGAGALGATGVGPVALGPLGAVPLPALTLLALAVPLTKLLLAGSVETAGWLAAGPRPRAGRPALPRRHRVVRGVTVGVLGLALTALAVAGPVAPAVPPEPAAVGSAP